MSGRFRALWLADRIDEAEAMADTALRRLPQDPDALVLHAWLAVTRENWQEAARRWARARDVAPDRPEIDVGLVKSLRLTDRIAEAEEIVEAALARFPGYTDLMIERVWLAICRGLWPEAIAAAQATRRRLAELGKDSISLGAAEYRIAMRERADVDAEAVVEKPKAETGELPPVAQADAGV